MLQPTLGTCLDGTGFPAQDRIRRGAQILPCDWHAIARTAIIQLAAIDQFALRVKKKNIRRARRLISLGHGLRLVVKVRKRVTSRFGLLSHHISSANGANSALVLRGHSFLSVMMAFFSASWQGQFGSRGFAR
jgi:hypothetical protein